MRRNAWILGCMALTTACAATAPGPVTRVDWNGPRWNGATFTALEVSDLERAKRWYHEVLGCELVYELPEHGWCELSTPTPGALVALARVEPGATPGGNGASFFSLGVHDIEAARAWLLGHQVAIEELIEIPGVVKLCYFTDLDGNRLMLFEPHQTP